MFKARPRRRSKTPGSLPLLQLVPTAGTTLALPAHTVLHNNNGELKGTEETLLVLSNLQEIARRRKNCLQGTCGSFC